MCPTLASGLLHHYLTYSSAYTEVNLRNIKISCRFWHTYFPFNTKYRGADKSLAQPWKETSYNDQDLQNYTKTMQQKYMPVVCMP